MKLIGTALTLSILALLAVWYLPTMYWGYQISRAVSQAQSGDDAAFETVGELAEGPPLVAWLRNNKKLNAAFNPTDLTTGRYVSYKLAMPFEALLKPGETLPEPDFQELYAHARAPQTLAGYCFEVLGNLGTKCNVSKSNATLSRDGTVRIIGNLQYVPDYETGDPSVVKNGELISARVRLIAGRDLHNTLGNRAEVFEKARRICTEIRTLLGNCIISSISFEITPRDGVQILRASARFDAFADSTQYRRDSLQTAVDQIAEGLVN